MKWIGMEEPFEVFFVAGVEGSGDFGILGLGLNLKVDGIKF